MFSKNKGIEKIFLKSAVGIVLGSEQVSFGEMLVLPWQSLAQ